MNRELLVTRFSQYDDLIPVTGAHASSSGQEGELFFVDTSAGSGARCKIPTTTNPVVNFDYFQSVIDYSKSIQIRVKTETLTFA